jgi:hypothetical protein
VKYHGETSLNNEYTIKNGGQEYKTGPVQWWILVGGDREN